MRTDDDVALRWVVSPAEVDDRLRRALTDCWVAVSNAGGAVGFPVLPVDGSEVSAATDAAVASLGPDAVRLLVAEVGEDLAGWLLLVPNPGLLTGHWARLARVQTAPAHRGTGVGRLLMGEAARSARDDLGLEQLHLEARGGTGVEGFYTRLGWREVGRRPRALRLPGDERRDQVLMQLDLGGTGSS